MYTNTTLNDITVKVLGLCDYQTTYQEMLAHIDSHNPCQIWMLEHLPVYTKGKLSLDSHFRRQNNIPVVNVDRGGQVTYHGPGQLIVYPLIKLSDWFISPRKLVDILEDTTIETLKLYRIKSNNDPDARGVYIQGKKIASIGLKIKNGYSYHGIAINIDMDLSPFESIIACGNPNMEMTQLVYHAPTVGFEKRWTKIFLEKLYANRYNELN